MNTIYFKNRPSIIATSTVAGPKESCGNIGEYIENRLKTDTFGEKTFEKAERKMLSYVIGQAIKNAKLNEKDVNAIISGDLLNQIISSSYASRDFKIPYFGVYNACSTMTESMILASALIDGGYMHNIVCATGSHFSTAERQYRYPLELGSTRPPQSQWTVTGSGALVISDSASSVKITSATVGKVIDYGVTDANNMGAAMAPAAADTIVNHFKDTKLQPDYYDLILTGDLGYLGSQILCDLTWEKGYDISKSHNDCGKIIFKQSPEEYQGGSGAGCSAVVFNSYIMNKLKEKSIKRVLFVATGALLSTISTQQGESIPCIAHAITVES